MKNNLYGTEYQPKHSPALMLYKNAEVLLLMLSDEEAGMLVKKAIKHHLTGEHDDGEELPFNDWKLNQAYMAITEATNANEKKYLDICQKRAKAAEARWKREQAKASKENESD